MDVTRSRPRSRRINLLLAFALPVAIVTGLWANGIGTNGSVHPSVVHGVVGLSIVLAAPWKSLVVRRSWTRTGTKPGASSVLLFLVMVTVVSGLLHSVTGLQHIGPLTTMQVHIGAGLLAGAVLTSHVLRHPVRPRRTDLDRRNLVRLTALSTAALVTWLGLETAWAAVGSPGSRRRFTGSHERGSFVPERMPVTSWLNDAIPDVDPDRWKLRLGRRSLSLVDLEAYPTQDLSAVLDCTSGWYSEQVWTGIRLDHLLGPDFDQLRSIRVTSTTGYVRTFPVRDASRLWLAVAAGGASLSPGHGFPARLVAPDRRGFWWVKWVVSIEPVDRPWWIQLPFPAS